MSPAKQRGTYADDWAEIARRVKLDAQLCCVRCSCPDGLPADGECLTVHHFDGDKCNNERWNLMALCQRCHLSVQARVDPEIALLHEPNDWARPYIAGFYEAGRGVPGPTYELTKWIAEYEATGLRWPSWAPRPEEILS
jgi:hypothetical protein